MADEPAKIILGDTAITGIEQPGKRRFLRRKNRQRPPLIHCENCGALLTGRWCSPCGQAAIDYRRSFRHVIVDALDSLLNFESKFFATIGWLIARPWHLTNQFLAGRRVRYVHPLRLYLLVSILFFFVINYWAKSIHADPSKLSADDRADIAAELNDPDIPPAAKAGIRRALDAKGRTQPEAQTSPSPQTAVTPQPSAIGSPQPSIIGSPPPSVTSPPPAGDFGPVVQFDKPPADKCEKWLEQRAKEKMGEHGS